MAIHPDFESELVFLTSVSLWCISAGVESAETKTPKSVAPRSIFEIADNHRHTDPPREAGDQLTGAQRIAAGEERSSLR